MKTKSISHHISAAIGSVSGEYAIPDKSICVMTLHMMPVRHASSVHDSLCSISLLKTE